MSRSMSRRERKAEAKELIQRLEHGNACGIKAQRIAKSLIDMKAEPSKDMFDFLSHISFEGRGVSRTAKAPASSSSSSSPSSSSSSSFSSNTYKTDADSIEEIANWEAWTMISVKTHPHYASRKPKLLCIVVDRSKKMASSWEAVKYSVRSEIAAAKVEGPVRTSITVVDSAILDLVKFNKAVKGIPDYVRIGSGCAIMDALAFQIESAFDYSRANPKYASNIELLVYTKGLDTASTKITSTEKLRKIMDAAASIGFRIRVMDPSASNMAGRLGLRVDRVAH